MKLITAFFPATIRRRVEAYMNVEKKGIDLLFPLGLRNTKSKRG
jgi:hypothetical protein